MDAIVDRVFPKGTATRLAGAMWTPPALGYDPNLKPYPYDPDRAKRQLRENGYKGEVVKLWSAPLSGSPETPDILQAIQGYFEAAGMRTEFTPIEWAQLAPMFRKVPQTLPVSGIACNLYVDVPYPRPMAVSNIGNAWISIEAGGRHGQYWDKNYIDAEYLRLLNMPNLKELEQELLKLNRKSHAEYASLPVVARAAIFAVGARFKEWSPGQYGPAWHLETIKVK
jgi:ABC-type transport system substrate-binding protein